MIVQLVRCFDDSSREIITHVDGSVDPVRHALSWLFYRF